MLIAGVRIVQSENTVFYGRFLSRAPSALNIYGVNNHNNKISTVNHSEEVKYSDLNAVTNFKLVKHCTDEFIFEASNYSRCAGSRRRVDECQV